MRWPLIKARPSRSGFEDRADNTKMTSATQEEPSEIDTFYRLHTVNGVFQDPEAPDDRMRELKATGEHTTAEINAMKQGCRFHDELDEERQQVRGCFCSGMIQVEPAEWRESRRSDIRGRKMVMIQWCEDGGDDTE
ncbi:hypothetical protein Tco_0090805 [Tanacetum coccineum]